MSTEMSTAYPFCDTPLSKIFSNNFSEGLILRRDSNRALPSHMAPGIHPVVRAQKPRNIAAIRKVPIRNFRKKTLFSELTFRTKNYFGKPIMTLLTITDTMAYLNMSKSTVMRLIAMEAFDVIRIGRAVRVRQDVLDRFLDEHTTYARSQGVAS